MNITCNFIIGHWIISQTWGKLTNGRQMVMIRISIYCLISLGIIQVFLKISNSGYKQCIFKDKNLSQVCHEFMLNHCTNTMQNCVREDKLHWAHTSCFLCSLFKPACKKYSKCRKRLRNYWSALLITRVEIS